MAAVARSDSGKDLIEKFQSQTRGCLKRSTGQSLALDGRKWVLLNAALFVLPSVILPFLLLACKSLCVGSKNDAFGLVAICVFAGCLDIIAGMWLFPSLLAYKRVLKANISGTRQHRTHWRNITPRRWRQYFSGTVFTIFILGLLRRSLPLSVTRSTTITEINKMLEFHYNPLVRIMTRPCIHHFETVESFPRRLEPNMAMSSAGILADSHIYFKISVLGGVPASSDASNAPANQNAEAGPSQSSSNRPSRKSNTSRLMAALAEEHLDEHGDVATTQSKKRSRARKPKPKTQSDEETEYETDSGSASESDDSGIEVVMSNTELADGLPSKTMPEGARRKKQIRQGKRRKTIPTSSDNEEDELPSVPSPKPAKSTKARRKKNPVHLFYTEVRADHDGTAVEGTRYFKCCHGSRKIVKITKGMNGSLNNLVGHLQRTFPAHHRLYEILHKRDSPPTQEEIDVASGKKAMDDALAKRYLAELDTISKNIRDMFEAQRVKGQEPWDQAHFESLLAKWIAACDQPFSVVEEPEFRELLEYIHRFSSGKLRIPDRKAVAKRIKEMEQEMVDGYREMFKENTSNFALSLDAWTSSNGHAFLAIVIHFINNTGKLEECLIDFRELMGQHTGENMAESVWQTIELYGLKGRITAFVMDNATNNDTLVEHFAKKCKEESIEFGASNARMRCMPHTIHLAALKLLEAIGALSREESTRAASRSTPYQDTATESTSRTQDELLVELDDGEDTSETPSANAGLISKAVFKLRKIVRFVRSSPQQREKYLKEVQRSINKGETLTERLNMLILDVRTRWSSTHQMLRRACSYKEAVDDYAARNLREHELAGDEWKALEYVMSWLRSFRDATTQMSATKRSMVSTTHAIFRGLQDELKSIIRSLPKDIDPSLKVGLVEAHRKLSDYFEKFDTSDYYHWSAMLDPRIAYSGIAEDYSGEPDLLAALDLARGRLQTHYDVFYHITPSSASTTTTSDNLRSPKKNYTARYNKKGLGAGERNELQEYFRLVADMPLDIEADPVEWWHARRETFPNLYRLVRDILCIPGSAVAVERVFSGGRDVIGIRRASLRADTIRSLMLVKAQLRLCRKAVTDLIGDD